MNFKWSTKKWIAVFLHVIFWIVLFLLPYFLRPIYDINGHPRQPPPDFFYIHLIDFITWIAIFYFNIYLLIPRLFYKKKYWQYLSALVFIFLVLLLIHRLTFYTFLSDRPYRLNGFILFSIFPCVFIIALSIAFKMFSDQIKNEAKAKEKETENLKTELAFLRSQVSPHFMFNVLNNMVALARKRSDQLEPSLIKLSSLLRYMLYETNEQSVALEKEVEYLQSYIDLQQQRFGKNVRLHVDLKEIDNSYFIEPMLLIPFVENAYKHGIGMVEDAEIKIVLKVENGLLEFDVKNKFVETVQTGDQTTGIGLNNVERRLNLLYKSRHSLTLEKNENWFLASLKINIR
jgi:two-component system, LytTR family, sensor kinase